MSLKYPCIKVIPFKRKKAKKPNFNFLVILIKTFIIRSVDNGKYSQQNISMLVKWWFLN